MNTTKKLMTLLLALLAANTVVAHDFEQGGIYYNIIHADEVEVTFKGDSYTAEDKAYSGAVIIPETVTHDGVTYTVTTIGVYAFYECTELTSVKIPATVTVIRGAAFLLCSNLTDIVFPDSLSCIEDAPFTGTAWYENLPEGLIYIGKVAYKFKGTMPQDTCVVLEEGTLGIAGVAFINCSGMTDIVIPNTVTNIGSAAFKNCSGLTEINIPNSVTTIGFQAFMNTPWYDNQPEGLVYAGKVAYLYKGTMPDNTSIVLDEDTRGIATDAFRKCTGLTSVVIPDAVVNIGDGAFLQCSNMKSLSIGKSVDFIGEAAFNHCSALESITVASDNPHFDSRNDCNAIIETRSNKLVLGCRNTVIPDNIARIGLQAFYYCNALESVELPNTLTVIEDMAFTGCSGLTSLVIPNSVTDIRYYAFSGCSGLTSVVIPDAVEKLGAGAFGGCSSLTSLEIPKYLTEIKDYTFAGCSSLTSVEIPDSVVTIGARAFASCKKLESVTIGKSVAFIGVCAFANIDALTTVTCLAMTPPVAETDLYYDDWCFDDKCFDNATLYVPAEVVDDYRNAPTWERFINIQPISTPSDVPGDVNNDGEVNIADVNVVIDMILTGATQLNGDVNGDGEINIADVNAIIDIILGGGAPTPSEIETITVNGVSFNMVTVEGGTFTMGATPEQVEAVAHYNEYPAHQVTLSSYSIGQTEVTQALWLAVMGSNPSSFTGDLNNPVEMVSWDDCQEFVDKLNQMTGKTFRLPTEAEWEFAARGGNKRHDHIYAGSDNIDEVAWYRDNSDDKPHPVATKKANELGLYDMSGNVYEWCQDKFGNYSSEDQINPTGPVSGSYRIFRGGSFYDDARNCRVSYRYYNIPDGCWYSVGLRLAM